MDEFLTEFPPLIKHPYPEKIKFSSNDWEMALESVQVDTSVDEITWAKPGYEHGIKKLEDFLQNRIKEYGFERNNPLKNANSDLSPWFHFGMISVQRCILEIKEYNALYPESVKDFMEEAIIRRELSDNFCFYNKDYDVIQGAFPWARATLNEHR